MNEETQASYTKVDFNRKSLREYRQFTRFKCRHSGGLVTSETTMRHRPWSLRLSGIRKLNCPGT